MPWICASARNSQPIGLAGSREATTAPISANTSSTGMNASERLNEVFCRSRSGGGHPREQDRAHDAGDDVEPDEAPREPLHRELLSHSDTWAGCTVSWTTARTSAPSASRSSSSRRRVVNASSVRWAS